MKTGRIKLLPDHVANQIAAGEVVQRPASVVKELMENALDAGADDIKLIIKDGGKSLIQVVDNGSGMNPVDARMAFERHATSKIATATDLFRLQTKGFRGEALASIAAVAHVEMKTKAAGEELGTFIKIEGSKIVKQEPVATQKGTSIAVKNLFYNIPARRKFLKSIQVEMRHVNEEFYRLALAHPQISFSLIHNGQIVYQLPKSKRLQRISNLFGHKLQAQLVPVNEETDYIKIAGYIGKPEHVKLKRGLQYFFVNNRFIKSSYLNHALLSAYEGLIKEKTYPPYFVFFDIDPQHIDVNIHPTKTEVKFDDEQTVYSILKVAAKHSLGQFNLTPSMDFDHRPDLEVPYDYKNKAPKMPAINVDPEFNPFKEEDTSFPAKIRPQRIEKNIAYWDSLMSEMQQTTQDLTSEISPTTGTLSLDVESSINQSALQFKQKYIITTKDDQLLIIHQQRAHALVLFHELIQQLKHHTIPSQQLIFPVEIQLSLQDIDLLKANADKIAEIGFDVDFASHSVLVKGVPMQLKTLAITDIFEQIIQELSLTAPDKLHQIEEKIAMIIAEKSAIKTGQKLEPATMQTLLRDLFRLPARWLFKGKKVLEAMNPAQIDMKFDL